MTQETKPEEKPLTAAEIEAARKAIEESISRACLAVTGGQCLSDQNVALALRQKANANLIAAAPDLLNACRAAFDSIMKHCAETGDVIWIGPPHQLPFVHESVRERLRNVIAQAEGRAVEEI